MDDPPAPTFHLDTSAARILVVDDAPINGRIVSSVLTRSGYRVTFVPSGPKAIESAVSEPPDLILLDLLMPEMDGFEVCRHLRAGERTRAIPVIFLTAAGEANHLVRAFEEGAVDYLVKPFRVPELLARVRTHLELKFARETVERSAQRLEALNREKNEFLGIAAHDLKNPLSAIRGYSELIAEISEDDEIQEVAGRIREAALRMTDLVQKFLDVNAIERGEMKFIPVPCHLADLAGIVADSYAERMRLKGQTLQRDLPPRISATKIWADPAVVVQILDNLVSNAIKYSPPSSALSLSVIPSEGSMRCSVRDSGPGLGPEDMGRLFTSFARLSAKPTGGESSTGLGLSIARRMVEAMQGRIWCESQPGEGATFHVELPLAH